MWFEEPEFVIGMDAAFAIHTRILEIMGKETHYFTH